jgi:hypothetical protein
MFIKKIQNNKYHNIIIRVTLFIILLIGVDFVIGKTFSFLFTKSLTGLTGGGIVNNALAHRDYDIIIFGDSRAIHHYNPKIIAEETNMSCYNAGATGMDVHYALMLESLIFSMGSKAKIFVIELTGEMRPARIHTFTPFYGKTRLIDSLLIASNKFNRYLLLSQTFKFNGKAIPTMKNFLLGNTFTSLDIGGSLEGIMDTTGFVRTQITEKEKITNEVSCLYEMFCDSAKSHNVKVIITYSPVYGRNCEIEKDHLENIATIANKRNVDYEVFVPQRYKNISNFDVYKDSYHLNKSGATELSRLLAYKINSITK